MADKPKKYIICQFSRGDVHGVCNKCDDCNRLCSEPRAYREEGRTIEEDNRRAKHLLRAVSIDINQYKITAVKGGKKFVVKKVGYGFGIKNMLRNIGEAYEVEVTPYKYVCGCYDYINTRVTCEHVEALIAHLEVPEMFRSGYAGVRMHLGFAYGGYYGKNDPRNKKSAEKLALYLTDEQIDRFWRETP